MNFEIVLATNNKHKLQEVREILSPHGITVYGLSDLNIKAPEVEENGVTYQENALIKANSLKALTSFPIIADDSGLEIEAMDNKPGLHTARFAIEKGGQEQALDFILDYLKDKNTRKARFVCDIVLVNVEDKPLLFEGIANGRIALKKEGAHGFGYDPIFIPNEKEVVFALLEEKEKNQISHRAKALKKLLTYLRIKGLINK